MSLETVLTIQLILLTWTSILLKSQHPIDGLQNYNLQNLNSWTVPTSEFIQFIHLISQQQYWITISNIGAPENTIYLYDSSHLHLSNLQLGTIASYIQSEALSVRVEIVNNQNQTNSTDCGIFAIASATSLASGHDPVDLRYKDNLHVRPTSKCFQEQSLTEFPSIRTERRRKFIRHYDVPVYCTCRITTDETSNGGMW